jgi:hypothetical protein
MSQKSKKCMELHTFLGWPRFFARPRFLVHALLNLLCARIRSLFHRAKTGLVSYYLLLSYDNVKGHAQVKTKGVRAESAISI